MLCCSWEEGNISCFVNVTFPFWVFFSQLYFFLYDINVWSITERTNSQWRIEKDCPAW